MVMTFRKMRDLSELKVLLFLEEKEQLKHYLSILRFCGLRGITVAERLSEAIDHIVSERFDLIIVTHRGEAPGVTRFLEELKGFGATSSIPVLAILADGNVRNALCVLAKGVDWILLEPLSQQVVEDAANRILRDHFAVDPDKIRLNRAKDLLQNDELEDARKIYSELLREDSKNLGVYLGLFEVYCRMQEWAEAEKNIKKALELAKSVQDKIQAYQHLSRVFFHYGTFYERRHNPENAIKSYRTSLSLNPFYVQSIKALLQILQKRGEVSEIVNVLKEAKTNFPPYSHALEEIVACVEDLAQKFLDLNMPVQARRMYEQLVKLRHENSAIHLKVADFFLRHGQVSLVLSTLMAVSERIQDSDLLMKIGTILLDTEKRFMSDGKVNAPPEVDLRYFQARDRTRIIRKAQKAFQQGLLLDTDNPWMWLNTACCHLRLGEADLALEILERLKEANREDTDILASMIEILTFERAFSVAGEWLKEANINFPKDVRFYMLYAEYYRSLGRPYDAIGCLKKGMTVQPDHTEFIVGLARLYQELKQYSDAILYYEKAGKLMPADTGIQEGLRDALTAKYQEGKNRP